jgi:ribosomal protein S18 acetylase RimI-like enzyme
VRFEPRLHLEFEPRTCQSLSMAHDLPPTNSDPAGVIPHCTITESTDADATEMVDVFRRLGKQSTLATHIYGSDPALFEYSVAVLGEREALLQEFAYLVRDNEQRIVGMAVVSRKLPSAKQLFKFLRALPSYLRIPRKLRRNGGKFASNVFTRATDGDDRFLSFFGIDPEFDRPAIADRLLSAVVARADAAGLCLFVVPETHAEADLMKSHCFQSDDEPFQVNNLELTVYSRLAHIFSDQPCEHPCAPVTPLNEPD